MGLEFKFLDYMAIRSITPFSCSAVTVFLFAVYAGLICNIIRSVLLGYEVVIDETASSVSCIHSLTHATFAEEEVGIYNHNLQLG